jgi:hypothetical protein
MSAARYSLSVKKEMGVLVGRQGELARLQEAIHKRNSLLIWGEPGSGKSALVARVISQLPEVIASRCICARANGSPQDILRSITEGLEDDPLLRAKFLADTRQNPSFSRWVRAQTSLRLRGLLYRAAGEGKYWIFLEDLGALDHLAARIVKELIWNRKTPVYAIATGCNCADFGHAASLYWNEQQWLHVGGLPPAEARELLELCIKRFGLSRFNLEGFREDILTFSGMMPGAIVRMCASARDSRYHFEGRIKTKLLHIDYLLNCRDGRGSVEDQAMVNDDL